MALNLKTNGRNYKHLSKLKNKNFSIGLSRFIAYSIKLIAKPSLMGPPIEYDSVDLTEDDDDDVPVDLSSQSSRSASNNWVPPGNRNTHQHYNSNSNSIFNNNNDICNNRKICNNSPVNKEPAMTFETIDEFERAIKMLQNDLKIEETKLVLMKNIRNSQLQNQNVPANNLKSSVVNGKVSVINTANNNTNINNNNSINNDGINNNNKQKQNNQHYQQQKLPNGTANKKTTQQPQHRPSHQPNSNQQRSHSNSATPTSITATTTKPYASNHPHSGYTNTPSTLTSAASMQQHYSQLHEQHKLLQQQQQAAAILVEQTAAQKLSTAKLAVRKQLERTLQQLPALKSNPFDLSIIPNCNSNEFVILLGLEQVVDNLLSTSDQHSASKVADPGSQTDDAAMQTSKSSDLLDNSKDIPICCKCGIDFTTKWFDKSTSGISGKMSAVVCESCFRLDRKRSAAKQQEDRMNSAFARSRQQEKEVEKALALELEAARQQIEAINNSLASAVPIVSSVFSGSAKGGPSHLSLLPTSLTVASVRDRNATTTTASSLLKQSNQPHKQQSQQHSSDKQNLLRIHNQSNLQQQKPTHLSKQQSNQQHPTRQVQHTSKPQPQSQQQTKQHTYQPPSTSNTSSTFTLPTFPPGLDLERLMLCSEKMATLGTLFNHFTNNISPSTSSSSPSIMKQHHHHHHQKSTPYSRP